MKRLIVILLIISVIIPVFPQPVYAATEVLDVSGNGTDAGNGSYVGGAGDYTNLNTISDADYWKSTSSNYYVLVSPVYRSWAIEDFSTDYSEINSLTLTFRLKTEPNAAYFSYAKIYLLIGGTRYYISTPHYANWTQYTWVHTVNPATGVAWTDTDINNLQVGMFVYAGNGLGSDVDISYLIVTVDYDAPTAPIVSTSAETNNTNNSGTLNGTITSNGGSAITDYGFVWGTTSLADPGNTAPTASAYTASWENGATVAVGAISHATGATLTENTVYYFRSAAENAIGWSYGSELSFKTVGDPVVTTLEATNIATTTATINALIADANGQLCDIRFGYGLTSEATIDAYDSQTAWVENTYNTGQTALANLTGLTIATKYYFRAEIRNDSGTDLGDEKDFTTYSGIDEPSSVTAIPTSNTLSLTWTKGAGSSETLVRYSLGSYPLTTIDGTYAYLGTGNSVLITGLTSGTTIYVSLWGKTGALYSTNKKTTMSTLTAYTTTTTTPISPNEPDSLYRTPDDSIVSQIPIIGQLVQINADAFGMPSNMIWFLLYIVSVIFICIVLFRTSGSTWITISGVIISLGIGVVLKVGALMIVGLVAIIVVSLTSTHERR